MITEHYTKHGCNKNIYKLPSVSKFFKNQLSVYHTKINISKKQLPASNS